MPWWHSGNTLVSQVNGSNPKPYVGKMAVSYRRSAVYSTELWPTVSTGFLCPQNYPSCYDLYSVESNIKTQNKQLKAFYSIILITLKTFCNIMCHYQAKFHNDEIYYKYTLKGLFDQGLFSCSLWLVSSMPVTAAFKSKYLFKSICVFLLACYISS